MWVLTLSRPALWRARSVAKGNPDWLGPGCCHRAGHSPLQGAANTRAHCCWWCVGEFQWTWANQYHSTTGSLGGHIVTFLCCRIPTQFYPTLTAYMHNIEDMQKKNIILYGHGETLECKSCGSPVEAFGWPLTCSITYAWHWSQQWPNSVGLWGL